MHLYSIAILFAAHAHNVSSPNGYLRMCVYFLQLINAVCTSYTPRYLLVIGLHYLYVQVVKCKTDDTDVSMGVIFSSFSGCSESYCTTKRLFEVRAEPENSPPNAACHQGI